MIITFSLNLLTLINLQYIYCHTEVLNSCMMTTIKRALHGDIDTSQTYAISVIVECSSYKVAQIHSVLVYYSVS